MTDDLTPELLLRAYAGGIFPMAEHQDDPEIFWVDPEARGVLPLDNLHISRSLARTIRHRNYQIRTNSDFAGVINGCADRGTTWINPEIRALCLQLHAMGHAHSLEVWDGNTLIGGVYGITLGGAFFGESMFSCRRDASKIALAYLVHHLKARGFTLFDTQFLTPHLASLGAVEIDRDIYHQQLAAALQVQVEFEPYSEASPSGVIQRNTQTS